MQAQACGCGKLLLLAPRCPIQANRLACEARSDSYSVEYNEKRMQNFLCFDNSMAALGIMIDLDAYIASFERPQNRASMHESVSS